MASSTKDFAYASDIGVPSWQAIEALCRTSGIAFSVTATTNGSHVNGSYHYKGNAVDMASSAGSMQKLAEYLYQFAPYILELIHSGGSGYFVKNGKKVPGSYYGATLISQHYNHVHCAMTNSGVKAAQGQAGTQSGTVTQQQSADAATVKSATSTASSTIKAGCGPALMVVAALPFAVTEIIRLFS